MNKSPVGISPSGSTAAVWSSSFSTYLCTAGAAVGLGSIWRFPYLAGTGGGGAFVVVFALACALIATPLLVAEFALGRRSHSSPPEAAGMVATCAGLSSKWNAIGILGSLAAFLIFSYYSVVAAWVLAYTWKCAAGILSVSGTKQVRAIWDAFRASPLDVESWHVLFVVLVAVISARGLQHGIEAANKARGPALLLLLLIVAVYSLSTGDVRRGLAFAFFPRFSEVTPQVVLAAIGQAFYATGVGQAMMIAYGAYIAKGTSLARAAITITAAILFVSLLATITIFPLVFGYGMSPAQGPELVFEVLPRVFAEMPAGRVVGTLFFLLLVLAALMPSIALLEPTISWLIERQRFDRIHAVWATASAAWLLGIGSVLSFNWWSHWHPLGILPVFANKTFFDVMDYVSSNILLPLGALLTSALVGWRLKPEFVVSELLETRLRIRVACLWLLRYVCPLAILAVFVANAT